MDGVHLVTQSFHLLQHALPRVVAPLLGFREDGFGAGEIADRPLDLAQNLVQALLTHARELMHQVSGPFLEVILIGNGSVRVVRQVGNEPDCEPVDIQPAGMNKLIELASTLASGAFIAVLAAWLTTRSHNKQEQQAEIGALRVQADALTVAVMELQGAAVANRLLWEGRAERGRTFLLTLLAFSGGAARARIAGGTDAQSGLVGLGRAAELLSRERVGSKQIVAAVREPLTRAGTAAAPLMRCSDPAVVTATEQLLAALVAVEDTARLEAALEAFGRAVNAATAPQQSWWTRRRGSRTG
ncbi:hypothetical protein [Streptomyces sp. LN549]|uniref:hypothetical protein n=1 Tax=Streptomyces sp. LN549 TaxID=3112979 RepID=UPI003713D0B8